MPLRVNKWEYPLVCHNAISCHKLDLTCGALTQNIKPPFVSLIYSIYSISSNNGIKVNCDIVRRFFKCITYCIINPTLHNTMKNLLHRLPVPSHSISWRVSFSWLLHLTEHFWWSLSHLRVDRQGLWYLTQMAEKVENIVVNAQTTVK